MNDVTAASDARTAEAQLQSYVGNLDPEHQELWRSVRAALRSRLPAANELAYDYGRSLVLSYSPTDKGIDGIVATRADAVGVALYFNQGPLLPDPKRLLRGSGRQTRFIRLETAGQVAHPDIEALIAAAIEHATVPLPSSGIGSLMIKSDSTKRPVRRNPTA
jgi:hypothetical protein